MCFDLRAEVFELVVFGKFVNDGDHFDNVTILPALLEYLLGLGRWPLEGAGKIVEGRYDATIASLLEESSSDILW